MKNWLIFPVLALCLSAQVPSEPPTLIRLIRAAGMDAQGMAQGYRDARAPVTVLGMAAITGPTETWLIEMLDSFAGLQELDKALAVFPPLQPTGRFSSTSPP